MAEETPRPQDLEAIKAELLRLSDNPSKEGLQTLAMDIDKMLHPEPPAPSEGSIPPPTVPRTPPVRERDSVNVPKP